VPIGIILFFKEKNIQKSLLIIPVFFMILPSLYAYTVPALDSRYLFPILPILCIFGTFACIKYLGKMKYKKIGITVIIIIIIFSSTLFLNYKNSDVENEQEFLKLANIINEKTDILLYIKSPINSYLEPAQLLKLEKFPVMSSYYSKDSKLRVVDYNSIEDFFLNIEKKGITHIILDDEVDNPIIIKEIFGNYEEYENLKKVFDSQENGFDYKIKIFEIKY
jgi:4-amino-4-deoxy-L-arabinose transferase-like glycosyltransferase